MRLNWIRVGSICLLLSGLSIGLGARTEASTPKTVQLDFDGQVSQLVTTAPDVATFLIEQLDGYEGLQVSPPPATKLFAGDIVRVVDSTQAPLAREVATNLRVALTPTPPPPPAPAAPKPKPVVIDKPKPKVYSGLATWYNNGDGLTSASRQFPNGTRLRVIAVNSGKSVDITINDYGPSASTGIALDLNKVAFAKIAPLGAGKVEIRYYKIS
jgi:hypothetical protein